MRDKSNYRAANTRAQVAIFPPSSGLAFRPWRRFSRRFATGRAKSCPRPYLRPPPHSMGIHSIGIHSYGMDTIPMECIRNGMDWYAMHCYPFHTNG